MTAGVHNCDLDQQLFSSTELQKQNHLHGAFHGLVS